MIYLIVLFALVWLSFYYDIRGKHKNKILWYRIMLVVFVLIAGLRWRLGIDTPPYLFNYYHEYPSIDKFSIMDYSITESPLFVLLNVIIKSLGGRFFIVQLIHSAIINILVFKFIKKNTDYIFTALFFYSITCYFTYNMEIMRGSLSIVICLYANDYFLDKKWLKGYALLILALLFHAQTLVMFILPLFFFLRFNKVGLLALIGAYFLGMIIMSVLSDYMFIFEANDALADKVSAYSNSDKYSAQGGNFYFFLLNIFPVLFYTVFSFIIVKFNFTQCKCLKYEPLIVLAVMFVLIRINLEIAYRYVDFFRIYIVLFLAESYVSLIKYSKKLSFNLAYFRAFSLFLPFIFVFLVYFFFFSEAYRFRYIPYSSVFDRSVSRKRELMYVEENASKAFYPRPKFNEY